MAASTPLREAGRRGGEGSSSALLVRIGTGDRDAFARLFDRLSPALLALARRHSGSEAAAASLVQEVFIRLWRSAPLFVGQTLPAEVWIMSLVDRTVGGRPPAARSRTATRRVADPLGVSERLER